MLTLRFTQVSPTHHRLDVVREDGSSESVELESKSFLVHDFLHYVVESEARLARAFFGSLADGRLYADLTARDAPLAGDLLTAERIVGPLTSMVLGRLDAAAFRSAMDNLYQALEEPLPPWVTGAFVAAVVQRYRVLAGTWKATPVGQAMELKFEL